MSEHEDFYTPEHIDEQVDALLQARGMPLRDQRLASDLHSILQHTDEDASSLQRVLQKLMEGDMPVQQQGKSIPFTDLHAQQQGQGRFVALSETLKRSTPTHHMKPFARLLNALAAVLVATLLVGMLVTVLALSHTHQSTKGASGKTVTATTTPTATATPLPAGSVVYTQSPPKGTNVFPYVAWSPDSKRIATLVVNMLSQKTQLQIWDATTGGDLQTVPLADDLNEVLWSPTGRYLALSNLQTIVIVDSQTGSIVNTINFNPTTASSTSVAGQSLLSSRFPYAGGVGFYSVAWTPDGTSLAIAVSYGTSGKVELVNPVTSTVNVTFSANASTIATALSFSTDGQYLAVSYPNDSRIVVWKVSTQAIAFQQNDVQAETIAWQPGTHTLAREVLFPASVQLWDIGSKKLVKTYSGITSFIWSPDGKELAAYTSLADTNGRPNTKTGEVTILDAASGTQVALYKSQHPDIYAVFWSPDGRYLASAEPGSTGNQILVWIA